jgi:hypothetical protein
MIAFSHWESIIIRAHHISSEKPGSVIDSDSKPSVHKVISSTRSNIKRKLKEMDEGESQFLSLLPMSSSFFDSLVHIDSSPPRKDLLFSH